MAPILSCYGPHTLLPHPLPHPLPESIKSVQSFCVLHAIQMGVVGMCKEHLGVALALKIPVFFVITKVDICPEHILKQTVQVGQRLPT